MTTVHKSLQNKQ